MNTVLVGAQWGDEGKGKVIDILTEKAHCIVRFQGGNNAGHTVKYGDKTFVLHLLPSGILRKGKICIIGNGVVVDPEALFEELDMLKKKGINVKNRLFISEQAHLIFPYHRILDKLKEESSNSRKIGTTQRGIGPCYEDKMSRLGIRVVDLQNKATFLKRLKQVLAAKNKILTQVYGQKPLSYKKISDQYISYRKRLLPFIKNTSLILSEAIKRKKPVLFEGAQGTLLDVDHGTYPYVTSSNSSAGGAITGTGVGPTKIDEVLGVVKAYTTRVGEGPFPTEFPAVFMKQIQSKGDEFGATTGRPRRCGWFDALIGKHAVLVNGLSKLAVMKLDVLDELKEIKICTGYKVGKKLVKNFPPDVQALKKCTPVYETHKGWLKDTTGIKRYKDLPLNARKYLKRIESLLETPISLVSIGSKRDQTIVL